MSAADAGPVDYSTPRDAAIERESPVATSGEEFRIMREGVRRLFAIVFSEGLDPFRAFPRFCTQAYLIQPEWFGGLTQADRAAIFGQGRAAEQARESLILRKLCKAAGYKSLHLPHHKSTRAKAACARAQRGNRNRARGAATAAAAMVNFSKTGKSKLS
ncbi:MAG: hypothetical protein LBO05_04145 [Deltaproteobacteria bacterium]|nr:hypothetical protein [Deltaproteobacteria bacterium]